MPYICFMFGSKTIWPLICSKFSIFPNSVCKKTLNFGREPAQVFSHLKIFWRPPRKTTVRVLQHLIPEQMARKVWLANCCWPFREIPTKSFRAETCWPTEFRKGFSMTSSSLSPKTLGAYFADTLLPACLSARPQTTRTKKIHLNSHSPHDLRLVIDVCDKSHDFRASCT